MNQDTWAVRIVHPDEYPTHGGSSYFYFDAGAISLRTAVRSAVRKMAASCIRWARLEVREDSYGLNAPVVFALDFEERDGV